MIGIWWDLTGEHIDACVFGQLASLSRQLGRFVAIDLVVRVSIDIVMDHFAAHRQIVVGRGRRIGYIVRMLDGYRGQEKMLMLLLLL